MGALYLKRHRSLCLRTFKLLQHNLVLRESLGSSFYLLAQMLRAKFSQTPLITKLVGYRKVHAITSPTATHKPIWWHPKGAGAKERTLWASKLIYQAPVAALGLDTWARVSWQTATTRGPEQGSAHLQKGCMEVTVGQEDQISAQILQQRAAQVRQWKWSIF